MKKIVSTSFIILTVCISCLAQLKDDFSDGDYFSGPAWENSSGYFKIENGMLRLGAPAVSGQDYITTSSHYIYDATWEFRVRLEFNPSSYNYADVYLFSDDKEYSAHVLGYFVRIGGQHDAITLFRRDGDSDKMTAIIDSPEKLTDIDSVDFHVKVTRDREGTWKLYYKSFPHDQYLLIGNAKDELYHLPNYFGINCHYTSSRSNKFYFDDININGDMLKDLTPPALDSVYPAGDQKIFCQFNEKLNKSSALNTANYILSGVGNPDSAEYDPALKRVILYINHELTDGGIYTLQLKNLLDLAGNKTGYAEINFTFFNIRSASPGTIVINEFLPDPFPEVGLPGYEYIELFNPSDNYINLSGCMINTEVINNLILSPGGYAILCPESAVISFSGLNCPVRGINKWKAIDNSGDYIMLDNSSGETLDKVEFSTGWFNETGKKDGGWSLELINSDYRCWGRKSWAVSVATSGGTPGRENSVHYNTVENLNRGFLDYYVIDNMLSLEFADPVILANESNFFIEGNTVTDKKIESENPYTVNLTLQDNLKPGKTYNLQINKVQDCSFTYKADTSITIGAGIEPGFLDVLITEIMNRPAPSKGLPEVEYIELYNPGTRIINLAGSYLISGEDSVLLPQKCLLPNEYRVLARANNEEILLGHFISLPDLPSINDNGENLKLKNAEGNWICQVRFKKEWFEEGIQGGISIEMIDPQNPCDGAPNWKLSEAANGGTPGRINSVNGVNPDNTGPVFENISVVNPNQLLLKFSEAVSPDHLMTSNFLINGDRLIRNFNPIELDEVYCSLSGDLEPGITYTLKAGNVTDCTGNLIRDENSDKFSIPAEADSLDIIINEILFNPFPGGVDYVELFNNSDKFIDLNNFSLSGETDSSEVKYPVVRMPFIMKPDSYYAFTVSKNRTINDYPQGLSKNIIETDGLPVMNNDHGSVVLISGDKKIIDAVNYNEGLHFSLLKDPDGVSLERIDPSKPSDDPENWLSASETSGFGTPGMKNSCSFPDSLISGHIQIEPKVFIPGNSGTIGYVRIYYTFDKPGMVANVRVFNVNGAPVRYLVNNETLSTSGYFSWDGINERGSLASTGYYIIAFEVFNLDGTHKSFIDKVVLGTQF